MRKSLIVTILVVLLVLTGCSKPSHSIRGEEVIVSLRQIDVHFKRGRNFSDTYMVFGAHDSGRADTISQISISGIKLYKAISIYKRYPDFHKCKSPGAAVAQNAMLSLYIIPADSEVLNILKNAVSQHEKNFKNKGDRIFVKLEGEVLKMTKAIIRKVNGDVTDQLHSQMRRDRYLVNSVEIVEAKIVFGNS